MIGRGSSDKLRQAIIIGTVQMWFFAEAFDEDFNPIKSKEDRDGKKGESTGRSFKKKVPGRRF